MSRTLARWAAEEKRRRAAWEIKKTADIKDITIKGMEPEVQRMVADHRLEIQKLGDRHREAIKQQEAELAKAHEVGRLMMLSIIITTIIVAINDNNGY